MSTTERAGDIEQRPPDVRIHLLGGFRVVIAGQALPADAWKRLSRSLVKLLALAPSREHSLHREELMEWLWPDLEPDAAANNLRHTLHLARRALRTPTDTAALVDIVPHAERLVLRATGSEDGQLWIDIDAFELAAADARGADDAQRLQAALDLYTGELLPDDRYEDWTTTRREQLHALFISLLFELARLHEAAREDAVATGALRRIIEIDPAHEDAAFALMNLYARMGQRTQALREYQRLRNALQRELDAEPSADTQRIYANILSGRGDAGPPPAEPAPLATTVRHNLPAPRTDLIGRSHNIAEVCSAISAARIVTITGMGGVGKTRLALAVGQELLAKDAFADGVWLVELGALTEPDAIPAAIADALTISLPADGDRDERVALATAMQSRRLLLVLDNCEHLIDAAARVIDQLLSVCPLLSVLATSREPLRLTGEIVYRMHPLEVPDDGATPGDIAANPAGQLFRARARALQPGFDITEETGPGVASICRQLDGLPLAIELAAARIVVLGVHDLAHRLGDALPLLSKGERTAVPRQQTLRATLEWSYDLLTADERAALIRLSVFRRGWTLAAAEAVIADERLDRHTVLGLLKQLIDKSLVSIDATGHGLRYRMLEPVRQFANDRLDRSSDAHAIRTRHASCFLTLAEEQESRLRGAELAHASELLETERDNLRAAFDWLRATGPAAMLRFVATMGRFWYVRGYVREGRELIAVALSEAPADNNEFRLRAVQHAGILAEEAGDHDQAVALLEQALAMLEQSDDRVRAASVLNSLGIVERARGDLDRAQELLESSLAIRRPLGDPQLLPAALGNLALLIWTRGDLDRAEALLDEVIAIARDTGDDWSLALCATDKGRIAWQRAQYARPRDLFDDSLARATTLYDLGAIADALEGLAGALAALGEPDRAARLWGASESLRETHDVVIPAAERDLYDQMVALGRERLDPPAFTTAWDAGRDLSLEQAVALAAPHPDDAPVTAPVLAPAPATATPLTQREQEIASLVARGLTNRQIAKTLGLAPRTADTHVSNILRKLGLSSRTDLQGTSSS